MNTCLECIYLWQIQHFRDSKFELKIIKHLWMLFNNTKWQHVKSLLYKFLRPGLLFTGYIGHCAVRISPIPCQLVYEYSWLYRFWSLLLLWLFTAKMGLSRMFTPSVLEYYQLIESTDAYVRQWTRPSLVQIMACHLFHAIWAERLWIKIQLF